MRGEGWQLDVAPTCRGKRLLYHALHHSARWPFITFVPNVAMFMSSFLMHQSRTPANIFLMSVTSLLLEADKITHNLPLDLTSSITSPNYTHSTSLNSPNTQIRLFSSI